MKLDDLFLLLVIAFVVIPDDIDIQLPKVNASMSNYSIMENEGMVAVQAEQSDFGKSNNFIDSEVVPTKLCKCNGTKKVTNELGLTIKCPCGDSCPCKSNTGMSPVAEVKKPVFKLYEFTVGAGWCGFCNDFTGVPNDNKESSAEQMKRLGWGVDREEKSLMNVFDVEKDIAVYDRFKKNPKTGEDSGYPFFVMTIDGKEVDRVEGNVSPKVITDMFFKYYKE